MSPRDFGWGVVGGFAFGLGFAFAAAAAALLIREIVGAAGEVGAVAAAKVTSRTAALPTAVPGTAADVRVASHRVERRYGDTVVLGMLRNDGDAAVGTVRVEASYFDASGKLVDLCGYYVASRLAPGEEKPFKVGCGGTPERPTPESASVRLRLVEAY